MNSEPLLTSPSETLTLSPLTDSLIREFLFRFGVEYKEDVAPRLPLWRETFGGMDPVVLERLFNRALKRCRFFPKISDILEPLQKTEEVTLSQVVEDAWQRVCELPRLHWNTDIPSGLCCRLALLPDRVRHAARVAGVFRNFETEDGLHVWAKKRFIESFVDYGELQRDQFPLPDGDIKNVLVNIAQKKALPAASEDWDELRHRGEAYTAKRKTTSETPGKFLMSTPEVSGVVDEAEVARQRRLVLEKYPKIGSMQGIPPELRPTQAQT
jgi:hypothetical protein